VNNLLVKIITCPAVVWASAVLLKQVDYASFAQILGVGWVLALIGYGADQFMLGDENPNTTRTWTALLLDLAAGTLVVWLSVGVLPGARVSFTGALLTGVLLAAVEYITHRWLAGRVRQRTGLS